MERCTWMVGQINETLVLVVLKFLMKKTKETEF